MLVDLHLHSSYSDGRYSPAELVRAAVFGNVRVVALTDHDSWNGYPEAAAAAKIINMRFCELCAAGRTTYEAAAAIRAELGAGLLDRLSVIPDGNAKAAPSGNACDGTLPLISVINGIELGTQYGEEPVHILGYHVNRSYAPLGRKLDELRHKREHRLEEMLERLHSLGIEISVEACDPKSRSVGRPHIAKAMVAKGYVATVQEAFDKYLRRGGPGYVPQPKLTPEEAVELIHRAGGLAVMAHPAEIRDAAVPELLLQKIPFDGLEVWHPSALEGEGFGKWLRLAQKYRLLTSGGSDFHGIADRYPERLGMHKVFYADTEAIINFKNELAAVSDK